MWAVCESVNYDDGRVCDRNNQLTFCLSAIRLSLCCLLTAMVYEVYYLALSKHNFMFSSKKTAAITSTCLAVCSLWSLVTNVVRAKDGVL